jgi:hypothetical protein
MEKITTQSIDKKEKEIKHYIGIDTNNYVIRGYTTQHMIPLESDICINENGGEILSLNGCENPSIVNENGSHNYKYVNNEVRGTSIEEQNAELKDIRLQSRGNRGQIKNVYEKLSSFLKR